MKFGIPHPSSTTTEGVWMARVFVPGRLPRKNERHVIARSGRSVRLVNSKPYADFCRRIAAAFVASKVQPLDSGELSISVVVYTDRSRHLDVRLPFVDIDACVSGVLDGLQLAKVVDNDVRFGVATLERDFIDEGQAVLVTIGRVVREPCRA